MKLKVSKKELIERLQACSRVTSSRPGALTLTGVKFSVTENGVELRATNSDTGIKVPLNADIDSTGEMLVPSRLLLDVVKSSPVETVALELDTESGTVAVESGSAKFKIKVLRDDDFPTLPDIADFEDHIKLSAGQFAATVERVVKSASKDETRPVLTGVNVVCSGTSLRMVATDSYRLSVKETELAAGSSADVEANVPAHALREVCQLVKEDSPGDLTIAMNSNQIIFSGPDFTLSSRLIDGQFPDYKQLVPNEFEYEVKVSAAEVAGVVGRVSLMAQKSSPLRVALSNGELTVTAQTPDVGEAQESLPVSYSGDSFEIGFNPGFLREGFESVESDEVTIRFINPLRPGLIEGDGDKGFIYLIMPIRLT